MSALNPHVKHLRLHLAPDFASESFLRQRVQPGLSGLMDGALSTLAPIFAVVLATHQPLTAFITGVATALGAGVSMAFSEGLSDTGELTGRGSPVVRGAITGAGTFLGGRVPHPAIPDSRLPKPRSRSRSPSSPSSFSSWPGCATGSSPASFAHSYP